MKRNIKYISILCCAALTFIACEKENKGSSGEGSLSLCVETVKTKAMSDTELLENADVRIYKADFSGMVRQYKYSEIPASIYLPADDYRIDVKAGGSVMNPVVYASWDQKSYAGSENVTIKASTNSSVTVEAKISNAVTNISFDSSISELLNEGYTCTIGLSESDSSQQLVYTASESEKDGYFLPSGFEPSLYWTFSGTLKKDGSSIVKSGRIDAVESAKLYNMSFKYTEKDGLLNLDIVVDDSTTDIYDGIIFVPVSTGLASTSRYEIWAGHFTAYADVDEGEYDPEKVYIEYRASGSEDWIRTTATRLSEGSYSSLINNLSGSTEYEYRLVVTSMADGTEEIIEGVNTITTDIAPQAPNHSFETTSNAESNKYLSLYDPASADPTLQSKWWCNGNNGSTTVSASHVICYPDKADYKDGNQSIVLESRYVVIKFAAGNLFSGHFGKVEGTKGGTVFFGRPFTARPTGMRLWAKYSGGKINRVENPPAGVSEGQYDKASLRIALGTWDYKKYGGDADSPILINTIDTSTFVDFSTDESTIAFGEKILTSDEANSTNVWQQITIPLEYRDVKTTPTHIVISFAASMYGDYFTGYDQSKLWIDKVELLYE